MRQRNAACSAFGYMERGFMNWTDLLKNEGLSYRLYEQRECATVAAG